MRYDDDDDEDDDDEDNEADDNDDVDAAWCRINPFYIVVIVVAVYFLHCCFFCYNILINCSFMDHSCE